MAAREPSGIIFVTTSSSGLRLPAETFHQVMGYEPADELYHRLLPGLSTPCDERGLIVNSVLNIHDQRETSGFKIVGADIYCQATFESASLAVDTFAASARNHTADANARENVGNRGTGSRSISYVVSGPEPMNDLYRRALAESPSVCHADSRIAWDIVFKYLPSTTPGADNTVIADVLCQNPFAPLPPM